MLHVKRQRPLRADQHGASSVEFALVVPIFLLVVFGILYFGFILARTSPWGMPPGRGHVPRWWTTARPAQTS